MKQSYIFKLLILLSLFIPVHLFSATQSFMLNKGWNLVGSQIDNIDVQGLYQSGDIEIMWGYENGNWKAFYPPKDRYEFDKINSADGFWIKSNQQNEYMTITGSGIKYEKTLPTAGWYLLTPTLKDIDVEYLFEDENKFTAVWTWEDSLWTGFIPSKNIYNLKTVKKGQGFWVKTKVDNVTINLSYINPSPEEPTEENETDGGNDRNTTDDSNTNNEDEEEIEEEEPIVETTFTEEEYNAFKDTLKNKCGISQSDIDIKFYKESGEYYGDINCSNAGIEDIDLYNFKVLSYVYGNLDVSGNNITTMEGLQNLLSFNNFYMHNNPSLTNVAWLSKIFSSTNKIWWIDEGQYINKIIPSKNVCNMEWNMFNKNGEKIDLYINNICDVSNYPPSCSITNDITSIDYGYNFEIFYNIEDEFPGSIIFEIEDENLSNLLTLDKTSNRFYGDINKSGDYNFKLLVTDHSGLTSSCSKTFNIKEDLNKETTDFIELLNKCGTEFKKEDYNQSSKTYKNNLYCNNKDINDSDISGLLAIKKIDGVFDFSSNNITNLNNFSNLEEVNGSLILFNNKISTIDGLLNLNKVSDTIDISFNSISNVNGLNELAYVGGDLILDSNNISDISGLKKITSIGKDYNGSLKLRDNEILTLGGYETDPVSGEIIHNGLSNLTYIAKDFLISSNKLQDLAGLSNLSYVGGDIKINKNPSLIDIRGLSNVSMKHYSDVSIDTDQYLHKPLISSDIFCQNTIILRNSDDITIEDNDITRVCKSDNNIPECILSGNLNYDTGLNIYLKSTFIDENKDTLKSNIKYNQDFNLTLENDIISGFILKSGEHNVTLEIEDEENATNQCQATILISNDITIPEGETIETLRFYETLKNACGITNPMSNFNASTGNYLGNINCSNKELLDKDLNNFKVLKTLEGDLSLEINKIKNVNGLSNLTSINGNLYLQNNDFLEDLSGLSNLTTVENNIFLYGVKKLKTLDGLNSLTTVNGTLMLNGNDLLSDISGLKNLQFSNTKTIQIDNFENKYTKVPTTDSNFCSLNPEEWTIKNQTGLEENSTLYFEEILCMPPNIMPTCNIFNSNTTYSFDTLDDILLEYNVSDENIETLIVEKSIEDDSGFTLNITEKTLKGHIDNSGNYKVSLKITDEEGVENTCERSINITDYIPPVDFPYYYSDFEDLIYILENKCNINSTKSNLNKREGIYNDSINCNSASLSDTDLEKFKVIKKINGNLLLSTNMITEIENGLFNLEEVESINLSNNFISNVNGLEKITSLDNLYLNDNNLTNISALTNLKNINLIDISNNQLVDLSGITNLETVDNLNISSNKLNDLNGFPLNVNNISILNISDNNISDISNISSISSITNSLFIHKNNISDLRPLENITPLTNVKLYIDDNVSYSYRASRNSNFCNVTLNLYNQNNVDIEDVKEKYCTGPAVCNINANSSYNADEIFTIDYTVYDENKSLVTVEIVENELEQLDINTSTYTLTGSNGFEGNYTIKLKTTDIENLTSYCEANINFTPYQYSNYNFTPTDFNNFFNVIESNCNVTDANLKFNQSTGKFDGTISCQNDNFNNEDLEKFKVLTSNTGNIILSSNSLNDLEGLRNFRKTEGAMFIYETNITNVDKLYKLKEVPQLILSLNNNLSDFSGIKNISNDLDLSIDTNKTDIIKPLITDSICKNNIKFLDTNVTIISTEPSIQKSYSYTTSNQQNIEQICNGDIEINNFTELLNLKCNIPLSKIEENMETNSSYNGNIYCNNKTINNNDLLHFSGLNNVIGDLDLSLNNINNISGLDNISTIVGNLYLEDNNITNVNELSNLNSVSKIYLKNDNLNDISGLKNIFDSNLKRIYLKNIENITLKPLINSEFCKIGWNIRVWDENIDNYIDNNKIDNICNTNIEINSLNELLTNKCHLSDFYLENNNSTYNNFLDCKNKGLTDSDLTYLNSLNNIKGYFDISSNNLTNLNGLSDSLIIDGDIHLYDNQLNDISNLNGVESTTNTIYLDDINYTIKAEDNSTFCKNEWDMKTYDENMSEIDLYDNWSYICNLDYFITEEDYNDFNNTISNCKVGNVENINKISAEYVGDIDCSETNQSLNTFSLLKSITGDLNLSKNNLTDITFLSNLKSVNNLYLKENSLINNNGLENLNKANIISLKDNNISDVSNFNINLELNKIDVSNNNLTNTSGLEFITEIDDINLSNNKISNLSGLTNLNNVTNSLDLSFNKITNLFYLSNLTNFSKGYFNNNLINDISDLTNLLGFNILDLSNNDISDISVLSGINTFTDLYLNDNNISDISVLTSVTGEINDFNVSNNNLISVSGLNNITGANSINISNNNILDISNLSNLASINNLNLSNNQISILSSLTNISEISNLLANNNQLNDLTGINIITAENIDISNNLITDISELSNLTTITEMNLSHNNLTNLNGINNINSIEKLDISFNNINDISDISNLTYIGQINFSENNISDISLFNDNSFEIKKLYISDNNITDLNITNLSGLNELKANNSNIENLSVSFSELHLLEVKNNYFTDLNNINFGNILGDIYIGNNSQLLDISNLSNIQQEDIGGDNVFSFDSNNLYSPKADSLSPFCGSSWNFKDENNVEIDFATGLDSLCGN